MHVLDDIREGNEVAKKMLYILMIAIIPLLVILGLYMSNPDSAFLKVIADRTGSLPAVLSARNPLMSKVMDIYCKTAPLLSFFFLLSKHKNLRLKINKKTSSAVKTLMVFTILYFIIIYVFLFSFTELTTSGKLLRLMSRNDYSLTFFYISLYSGVYVFTSLYLWFFIGTYRIFKERS